MSTVFIYSKSGKIQALDLEDKNHDKLLKNGWKHTATLNPTVFISNLINCSEIERSNIISELKSGIIIGG